MALTSATGPLTQPSVGAARRSRAASCALVWADAGERAGAHRRAGGRDRSARASTLDAPTELAFDADAVPTDAASRARAGARRALHFDLGGALPLTQRRPALRVGHARRAGARCRAAQRADEPWRELGAGRLLSPRARRRRSATSPPLAVRADDALPARACPTSARRRSTPRQTRLVVQAPLATPRLRGAGPAAVPRCWPARRTRPAARCRSRRWCRSSTTSARASAGPTLGAWTEVAAVARQIEAEQREAQCGRCCCGRCCSPASPDSGSWSGAWCAERPRKRSRKPRRSRPIRRAPHRAERRRAERANCT